MRDRPAALVRRGRRQSQRWLAVVCGAVFVDMTGFGIVLPTLPARVEQLGGSGLWVGLLLTAYAAAQFVAAPVLGTLSDRHGRRRVLLLTLAGSAASMGLAAAAGSLGLLVLARLVAGGCGGAIAVGQAYAADLVPPARRTHALGLVGAAVGLGFVAGPAIGAGLAAAGLGFATGCLVAAGMAVANVALGWFLLPRAVAVGAAAGPAGVRVRLDRLLAGVRSGPLGGVVVAVFVGTSAFAMMETTVGLLVHDRFGSGPATLGVLLVGVGLMVAGAQAGLVGRISGRLGHRRAAAVGAGLLGLSLCVVPLAPAWLAYASLATLAVGYALLSTTTAALIAAAGEPAGRVGGGGLGAALGVGQSAAAAARATAPLLAGAGFDLTPLLPYLVAAAGCGVAAMLLLRPGRPALPLPVEVPPSP